MESGLALRLLALELTRSRGKVLSSLLERGTAAEMYFAFKAQGTEEVVDHPMLEKLFREDGSPIGKAIRFQGRKRWELPRDNQEATSDLPKLYYEDGQFQLQLNSYPVNRFKALDTGMLVRANSSTAVAPASLYLLAMLRRKLRPDIDSSVDRWEGDVRSIVIPTEIDRQTHLLEHQKMGAGFLIHRSRAMLVLSPGLGKTLTAITAANFLGLERVLVIAPLTLLSVWEEELSKWSPGTRARRLVDGLDNRPGWFLANPESLLSEKVMGMAAEHRWHALILDESILYKNRRTARSNNVAKIAKRTPIVWALTGSPVTKFLDDFFRPLQVLEPTTFTSYWRFTDYYCIKSESVWGTRIVGNQPGAEQRLRDDLEDFCLFQHMDALPEIEVPDWDRTTVQVRLSAKHSIGYRQLREDLRLSLPDGDLSVSSKLELTLRLLQMTTSPALLGGEHLPGKLDALVELIEERWPEPCIVWVNFRKTGIWVEKELQRREIPCGLINGDTSASTRQQLRRQFQDGDLKVLVMNLQTGKFGLSFPAVPMFYLERTFDRDAFVQSMHRNRRLTTTTPPRITVLEAVLDNGSPTIDRLVDQVLEENMQLSTELLRGHLEE